MKIHVYPRLSAMHGAVEFHTRRWGYVTVQPPKLVDTRWRGMTDVEFLAEVRRGISVATNAGRTTLGAYDRAWLWESYGDEFVRRLSAPVDEDLP